MIKKLCFILVMLSGHLQVLAQINKHSIDMQGDTAIAVLDYKGLRPSSEDSLSIHFPLQAYLDKGSFLNDQLRDFQDPDLHFAKKDELAWLQIDKLLLNGKEVVASLESEFLDLPINQNDSLQIHIEYRFLLPDAKFTGNGRLKSESRIIDLLPRIILNSRHRHPVSFNYDGYFASEHFQLSLHLPEGKEVISNLPIQVRQGEWFHFAGESKSLQFFIAKHWEVYELKSGSKLYLSQADPIFPANLELALEEADAFFKQEIGRELSQKRNYIFLDSKKGEYQSAELISLKRPKDWIDLRFDLVQGLAESLFRYQKATDGWQRPWIARGIPYYYKYQFIESRYPQKRWIPFQSPILNGLFGFDEFDFAYQNRFLFLFLQRQGLDQSLSCPVDSLSRLNYEAISQAKSFLVISHLRAYLGPRDFVRSMHNFAANDSAQSSYTALEYSLRYYSPKNMDWFFGPALHSAGLYDYQLLRQEHCPTVSTATIRNTGDLALPYSLTGFKDGKAVLTEWYGGHEGKRSVQMYHEDYDKVVINAHLNHAEYRQKNNTYYNRWLLPRMEPLSFQLYNSFEAAEASQIFYVPSVYYNAYDQFLLGINLSNRSILVQKPFEYLLVPEYSTGTGKLTGTASAAYNWVLPKNNFFRQIRLGVYSRYNHYDRDLAYYRISPSLNLYLRKKYPRSPYIQSLRFRGVLLNRELAPDQENPQGNLETASFSVFNANYRMEYTSLLRPTIFRFHFEAADQFGKLFADYDQRWMLPNKKWLILRGFAGAFLYNNLADQGLRDNYYSFGLSGTPDYLFDYYFIGRSDKSGIWSRQFFTTDGGFKSETQAFADSWLLSSNLSVPFIGPLGAFADIAWSEEQMYWDYGVRLALLTDFVELYLPLQNQDRNFYSEANYLSNVRFVLDLQLGNIINRLRRGYY